MALTEDLPRAWWDTPEHRRMVERVNLEQDLLRAAREWWDRTIMTSVAKEEAMKDAARAYGDFMARIEAEDK